ncbi:Lipin/Ned1/Smp2-domain-containing protein, partial [Powellomyces hirtus]
VSAVSAVNAFYSEVNPSTLSGAIDVVVIKHPDGDLVCSPFHVRFGKLKLLRPHDKAVTVTVNGQKQEDLLMKLGEAGEAFFVVETENPVPSEYATSPIQHAEDTNNVSTRGWGIRDQTAKHPQGNGIVETTPPGMEERDAKPETISEPESTPAEESTAQDSPPEAKVAIDKLPNGVPAAAADQMDRELFTPNSVMTDDPMVKTANAVASALESFIPVVPLHALSASASASALIDTPVASAMPALQELMKPPLPHSKSLPDKAKDGDIKLEGVVRGASPEPIKEEDAAEDAADAKSDVKSQQNFPIHFAKSLRLTSEQLRALNLNPGPNTITFSVNQSGASVSAKLFLYDYTCKIVISDIDGTITKSDALGHIFTMVGKDWTHSGIASLYTNIRKNGYHILYLTSRAIGQAGTTREYLAKVEQGGYQLPEGPVIMSPDRLFASFHRCVILRRPEEFKMACLRDIKRLFVDRTPFYAGFGNRITDALSYRSVDVPSSRIFTIDSGGEVKLELLADYKSSYIKLNDIVDQIFRKYSNAGGQAQP